jgi:hypothetical protein
MDFLAKSYSKEEVVRAPNHIAVDCLGQLLKLDLMT